MRLLGALALAFLLGLPGVARAHKPSDSYLSLAVDGARIDGQWDIALRDLEHAIGLDANGDGEITWGELRSRHSDIAAYALARLALRAGGRACPLAPTAHLFDEHSDGGYAVLRFAAKCADHAQELDVQYGLFFDLDPQHRGLARIRAAGATQTAIFSPERPTHRIAAAAPSGPATLLQYGREGVWHILIGFDHVLFLLCLLLPSVLVARRDGGRTTWTPVARAGPAFWDVTKVVTAFTAAHSITLSAAALGWMSLPSRLVESAIAASIAVAALNNLKPIAASPRWMVAFAFGLVHGFGFASVLSDLGLSDDTLVLALLGFNLGVEAGQLAIVLAFVALAFSVRQTAFYRRWVMRGGSVAIAVVAAVWFVERAFNLDLIG